MKRPIYLSIVILVAVFLVMIGGCSNQPESNSESGAQGNTQAANSFKPHWKTDVKPEDIARIKWLEGTWRGTSEEQEPFFERYTFDGTSMTIDTFTDSSLKTVKDTSRYALINGEFRCTKNEKRTGVSEITDDHIQFVPVVGDGNPFRFEKQPEGKWRAVLDVPAASGKPAKQVIYNMEPYKK